MKPFSPYNIIKQVEGESIELELPKGNKRLNFFTFRILPVIILITSIGAFYATYKDYLFMALFYGVAIPALSLFLFFRKYIISIKISKEYIEFEK
ncbi:MAG: hypothetical protein LC122_11365 [Chitinophagales bacterium]|nr:hypothetical protein [Chitinophagales bacterium]